MAYQVVLFIDPELQERLDESGFELFQNSALSGAHNFGSAADTIYSSQVYYQNISTGGGDDRVLLQGINGYNFTIKLGSGNDYLDSGNGNDLIYGGSGDDKIWGGRGDDVVYGGSGNDRIDEDNVYASNDTFYGGSGNDWIEGDKGDDKLWGGVDNDTLWGQEGADELHGGYGSDMLNGGRGRDILTGDAGTDTFAFGDWGSLSSGINPTSRYNPDQITDFSKAEGDKIDLKELDSNFDLAGLQQEFFFAGGPSNEIGAIWIEGSGADRMVYLNTSIKDGAEMAIAVHLVDASPSLTPSDFLLQ